MPSKFCDQLEPTLPTRPTKKNNQKKEKTKKIEKEKKQKKYILSRCGFEDDMPRVEEAEREEEETKDDELKS